MPGPDSFRRKSRNAARREGRGGISGGGHAVTETRAKDLITALDEASLSRFHLRAVLVSGMGFFTDAYDLFVIGIASTLITSQWHLSSGRLALLNSTMLFAAFLGAFVFLLSLNSGTEAQQPNRIPRIGILALSPGPTVSTVGFLQGLRDLGQHGRQRCDRLPVEIGARGRFIDVDVSHGF